MTHDTTRMLAIGRLSVSLDEAFSIIDGYVKPREAGKEMVFAWPYYDRYETGSDSRTLTDADLLAPALLNVPVSLQAYASLQAHRHELEAGLGTLPTQDMGLEEADEETVEAIGRLYVPIENRGIPRVQAVILAKILHRKRPKLVPLYDRMIKEAYRGTGDNLVPTVGRGERSWSQYMTLLTRAIQADLKGSRSEWDQVISRVPGLTNLRALDIVAWTKVSRSS